MNVEFKQFREFGSMIASFKYWYNSSFFPCSKEILLSQAEDEYVPKSRNKNG
jgi:hypothetical protein